MSDAYCVVDLKPCDKIVAFADVYTDKNKTALQRMLNERDLMLQSFTRQRMSKIIRYFTNKKVYVALCDQLMLGRVVTEW
jgi:hypothetical protein